MYRISIATVAAAYSLSLSPNPSSCGQRDYQRILTEQPWSWLGEQASLLYGVTQHLRDFDTTVECPRFDPAKPGMRLLTVRLLDGGKEVYIFQARRGVVFTRDRDVLYF